MLLNKKIVGIFFIKGDLLTTARSSGDLIDIINNNNNRLRCIQAVCEYVQTVVKYYEKDYEKTLSKKKVYP